MTICNGMYQRCTLRAAHALTDAHILRAVIAKLPADREQISMD
jgi:hypothetical protein